MGIPNAKPVKVSELIGQAAVAAEMWRGQDKAAELFAARDIFDELLEVAEVAAGRLDDAGRSSKALRAMIAKAKGEV